MQVSLRLGFTAGGDDYSVDLAIPTGDISVETPFFFIANRTKAGEKNGIPQPVLHVAVGSKDAYFVGVEPPSSILEMAELQDIVTELKVMVQNGEYNYDQRKFITGT